MLIEKCITLWYLSYVAAVIHKQAKLECLTIHAYILISAA